MNSTVCADQERLTRVYNAYLADYLRSMQLLEQLAGSLRAEEYAAVRKGADLALRRMAQARANLNEHLARHGCDRMDGGETKTAGGK